MSALLSFGRHCNKCTVRERRYDASNATYLMTPLLGSFNQVAEHVSGNTVYIGLEECCEVLAAMRNTVYYGESR
jgi:hypothetical protein